MSTQFDQIFEGLSKNSLTLQDACRVLYSESQGSPENMRVCCERIEIELSQGRITTDAAQLLLDALGERSPDDHEAPPAGEEMWVDVPLEPAEAPRPAAATSKVGGDTITEVDLTMDDLLAALDRRGTPPAKSQPELEVADELAAPVEWMEWEPDEAPSAPTSSSAGVPVADVEMMLGAELDLSVANAAPEAVADVSPIQPAQPAEAVDVALEPDAALAAMVLDAEVATSLSSEVTEAGATDAVPTSASQSETMELEAFEPVADQLVESMVATDGAAEAARAETLSTPPQDSIGEATSEPTIEEVLAPRVEHVLRESSPMAAGALLKDRYRIVGPLTPGGLGQLFEAIDMQVAGAPRVVLKLIEVDWQEEPRAFETLQAIVRHVRRLRHPNILSILDIDRDAKHAIIAMEALRGSWLSSLVREVRGRGVGYAVAWNVISGIANGLAYAHQHGAVHSELNPHMVFLTDTGQVKIVGFGLAHAMPMSTEPLAELDGQTLRSYADAYCATQWRLGSIPQGVDDLYPLGVIAYELLTGAHPFNRASPAAAANQQLQPLPIPGLDRRIRRVIERCLSFDRKDRPATGASFLAHIEPAEKLLDLVRERFT